MPVFISKTGQVLVPPDMVGFHLCTDGNANLLINGNECQASRGTLCLINPFLFTEIVSASADCKWEMIYDNKDIFHSTSIYIFYALPENNLFKTPCIQLDERQIDEFMFFVDKIKDKQNMLGCNSNEGDSAMLRHNIILLEQAAGIEFISLYLRGECRSSRNMTPNETIVFNFIDSVNRNYATHRDIEWYAEQANLTTNYFSRTVRQFLGYAPVLMIKHITAAYAKMMLAQSEISIKEVATRLNFSSQFTFSRYFKSCTGMSPSEYRKTGGV